MVTRESYVQLTMEMIKDISEGVAAGCFVVDAAGRLGIPRATLYRWLNTGRQARREIELQIEALEIAAEEKSRRAEKRGRGRPPSKKSLLKPKRGRGRPPKEQAGDSLAGIRAIGQHHPNWLHVVLVDEFEKAKAHASCRAIAQIVKAGQDSWQANAWYLERTNPQRWGRRDRVELTGRKGEPVKVEATVENTIDLGAAKKLVETMTAEQLAAVKQMVQACQKGSDMQVEE